MTGLLIGNFDFEHRLSRSGELPLSVRRIGRELTPLLAAVAGEGDFLWLPADADRDSRPLAGDAGLQPGSPLAVEPGFFQHLARAGLPTVRAVGDAAEIEGPIEVCPWGWTEAVRRLCRRHGWSYRAPPQEIVREGNSRQFSVELERAWGIGLPGAAVVRSLEELPAAIGRLPRGARRWVVKAEFGASTRERIVGHSSNLNENQAGWVRNRLAAGGLVLFEPWVERVAEVGLQYAIPYSGPSVFEGLTPTLSGPWGAYRGSRFSRSVEEELHWMPAIETGMRVARMLKQRGYFGPLGIDAMRYRDLDGRVRLRSVQDINARHTMGRLALGLRRILQPGESASWLHVRWPSDDAEGPTRWMKAAAEAVPPEVRLVRTSPFSLADRPVSYGTVVVAAPSAEILQNAESALRDLVVR